MRMTSARIELSAIQHNLSIVKRLAPNSQVMSVIKANAYGHGLIPVAQVLTQSDALAVACFEEALLIRQAGIETPLILLEGFFSQQELVDLLAYKVQTVVHHQAQIDAILSLNTKQAKQAQQQLVVWLKLDSGMNRLGFTQTELLKNYQYLLQHNICRQLNLMSHFACADTPKAAINQTQITQFKQLTANLITQNTKEIACSMANSAAILTRQPSHFDWVRPGIMLYGCSPFKGKTAADYQLKPVMNLESQLFSIKAVKAGESIGYGAEYVMPQDSHIGVVAIGYGDGYPRHINSGCPVWIAGQYYPLIGRVSMDMITVDLGKTPACQLGDRVQLWGDKLPVEEVANYADTIPYTLLCGVTQRVDFQYQTK